MSGVVQATNGINGHGIHPDVAKRLSRSSSDGAAFLGCALCHGVQVLAMVPGLAVDTFMNVKHKVVFAAMRALEHEGKPIDLTTVEAEIARSGSLDAIGGVGFLGQLAVDASPVEWVTAIARRLSAVHAEQTEAEHLVEAEHRQEHELDDFALRDAEAPAPKSDPLCAPLVEFLGGDEEPDDDDADDWIIRDLIPRGEAALWGGPMKSGKTWTALSMMLAVARGDAWLRFENTLRAPARVLGILLEDSKRRVRNRVWELCRAIGTTPNDPLIRENLRLSRELITLPDDGASIAKRLRSWAPKLIVIDNLTRVMSGDPNKTRDAAAFTKAWLRLGDELGATVVMLHHLGKQSGDEKRDPFDSLRGSSDFGAAARNLIVSLPLGIEGEHVSEVRMRGNLDLRCESFVLGFERTELLGRKRAVITDRGDVADLRKQLREAKASAKLQAKQAELARVDRMALQHARDRGSISVGALELIAGLSNASAARRLQALRKDGLLGAPGPSGSPITEAGIAMLEGRS